MNIWELKTKNGRVYRVAIENKNQLARIRKVIHDNKSKSYEIFTDINTNKCNGVNTIKEFEKLAEKLI